MKQADFIRQFVLDNWVVPARSGGLDKVTVRAGDVHRAMRLTNALPAVCSAIGSKKFEELAFVNLAERGGPTNGANVYFRFSLIARSPSEQPALSARPSGFKEAAVGDLDLDSALVLVSCVKSKLPHRVPARALYTSTWFRKTRAIVEASGARWFVLSSRYGLVAPDAEIDPYDYTLNKFPVAVRRDRANKVTDKLLLSRQSLPGSQIPT